MNADYKLKFFGTLLIVAMVSGCAGGKSSFKNGDKAEISRDYETAMAEYKKALDADPQNTEYRVKFERARFAAAYAHFQKGKTAMETGDLELAKNEFARAKEIDPSHDFAAQELERVTDLIAGRGPNAPVAPAPNFESIRASTRTLSYQSQLEPTLKVPITIHLSQPTRTAFETIGEMAGIHVLFDRDLRTFTPQTVTLDLDNVSFYQALDILNVQTKTWWQVVDKNTILIIEDSSTKRRDLEEVVLKVIYLSNPTTTQELNDIMNQVRQNLNITVMTAYPPLNALVIKDSPDKVAMAEKLAYALDKGKGEVVIEATIMEVDRGLMRQLGIQPPGNTALTFVPAGTTVPAAVTAGSNSATLRELQNIGPDSFALTIPQTLASFLATSSLTTLIQNPQLRATSGQQATLLVGSNIPIQTSNTQPTLAGGSTTTAVSYTNVGVTMVITPTVLLNREISVQVNVDVKALAEDRQVGNTVSPSFTDRNIVHTIRLKEGETNILGGLISNLEQTSMTGLPLLKDIPVLKYFFGKENKQRNDVEIIIMLTPHILKMPDVTAQDMIALDVGTVTQPRLPSLTVAGPNATEPIAPRPNGAAPAAAPGTAPAQPNQPAFGTPVQPTSSVAPQSPLSPILAAPTAAAPSALATPQPAFGTPVPLPAAAGGAPQNPLNGFTTASASAAQAAATISFPSNQSVMASQKATPVNIVVNGADISGAELTLTFDPGSISISQIADGGFLSRDGQLIAVVQQVESDAGTAHVRIERPPTAAALAGTGNLLTLTVVPKDKKGDSLLRVTDIKLRDSAQVVRSGAAVETRITVQ
jgi:general secretion pathway protein D